MHPHRLRTRGSSSPCTHLRWCALPRANADNEQQKDAKVKYNQPRPRGSGKPRLPLGATTQKRTPGEPGLGGSSGDVLVGRAGWRSPPLPELPSLSQHRRAGCQAQKLPVSAKRVPHLIQIFPKRHRVLLGAPGKGLNLSTEPKIPRKKQKRIGCS